MFITTGEDTNNARLRNEGQETEVQRSNREFSTTGDVGCQEDLQASATTDKDSLTSVSGLPTPLPDTHPTEEAQGQMTSALDTVRETPS